MFDYTLYNITKSEIISGVLREQPDFDWGRLDSTGKLKRSSHAEDDRWPRKISIKNIKC